MAQPPKVQKPPLATPVQRVSVISRNPSTSASVIEKVIFTGAGFAAFVLENA